MLAGDEVTSRTGQIFAALDLKTDSTDEPEQEEGSPCPKVPRLHHEGPGGENKGKNRNKISGTPQKKSKIEQG